MMRQTGLPIPARILYPDALFRLSGHSRRLCLTFDDGPDPVSTPVILEILRRHNVTATFFCTGARVNEFPGLFARIASEGHAIGNHGYSHLNGFSSSVKNYCSDVFRGRDITCSKFFRPPYGRIRLRQYKILERSMNIVFWDNMPYDFDKRLSPEDSLGLLNHNLRPGSIIVLHDTEESHAPLFLDSFLKSTLADGYVFMPVDGKMTGG